MREVTQRRGALCVYSPRELKRPSAENVLNLVKRLDSHERGRHDSRQFEAATSPTAIPIVSRQTSWPPASLKMCDAGRYTANRSGIAGALCERAFRPMPGDAPR